MCKESTNGREEGEGGTAMGERKERGEQPWGGTGTEREKENAIGGTQRVRKKEGGGETLGTVASVWMLHGDQMLTSSGLKDCFMWLYLRNLAMGRMLEPVYIMMKKKTPVENVRGSWGLSWE